MGFSKQVMDVYIIVVFQTVFNHANVHFELGPLKYLIVTPISITGIIPPTMPPSTKNAAHFAFLDYLFGFWRCVVKQVSLKNMAFSGRLHA